MRQPEEAQQCSDVRRVVLSTGRIFDATSFARAQQCFFSFMRQIRERSHNLHHQHRPCVGPHTQGEKERQRVMVEDTTKNSDCQWHNLDVKNDFYRQYLSCIVTRIPKLTLVKRVSRKSRNSKHKEVGDPSSQMCSKLQGT